MSLHPIGVFDRREVYIMVRTKKLKSAGRFGARYGKKIRALVAAIESSSRAKHVCPSCGRRSLKRISAGIWLCRKCGKKIAGGAYAPMTGSAKILMKVERITKLREEKEAEEKLEADVGGKNKESEEKSKENK